MNFFENKFQIYELYMLVYIIYINFRNNLNIVYYFNLFIFIAINDIKDVDKGNIIRF